jgi:hypothetical protein
MFLPEMAVCAQHLLKFLMSYSAVQCLSRGVTLHPSLQIFAWHQSLHASLLVIEIISCMKPFISMTHVEILPTRHIYINVFVCEQTVLNESLYIYAMHIFP